MADEKNKGGRPSKLTEELCEKAETYIAEKQDTELPSQVGLAVFLDISLKTLHNWSNIDENDAEITDETKALATRFLHTLEDVETYQHYHAVNRGLIGTYNSVITKLVLANHGYADKVNSDLTTNGNDITFINDVPRPTKVAHDEDAS
jgi:hypothetical protein